MSAELEQVEFEEMEEKPIDADDLAARALRIIAKHQSEIDRITKLWESEKEYVESFYANEIHKHQQTINHFTASLEQYMMNLHLADPKTKSRKFSYGTLKLRQQQPEITLKDDFNPEQYQDSPFVRSKTTFAADLKAIRDSLKETGEVPDWVEVTARDPKFSIELIKRGEEE